MSKSKAVDKFLKISLAVFGALYIVMITSLILMARSWGITFGSRGNPTTAVHNADPLEHASAASTLGGAMLAEARGSPNIAHRLFKLALDRVTPNDFRARDKILQMIVFQDQNSAPDYFTQLVCTDDMSLWPHHRMPIKIFVEDREDLLHRFLKARVKECLDQWIANANGKISYRFVATRGDADLAIIKDTKPFEKSELGDVDGRTRILCDDSNDAFVPTIRHGVVRLSGELFTTYEDNRVEGTILHELGHALGIGTHSSNPKDVMCAIGTQLQAASLTDRDKHTIARLYLDSCTIDGEKALKAMAERNNGFAQTTFGRHCQYAEGMPKDYAQALYWYKKAADAGLAEAQTRLGDMYLEGNGTAKDFNAARQYYTLAANQGLPGAMYELAVMNSKGLAGPKDPRKAVQLLNQACAQNYNPAYVKLGFMYEFGVGVQKNASKAIEMYSKAVDRGSPTATRSLSDMYEWGRGVKRDEQKALELYSHAAEQGDTGAAVWIGQMYESGRGVTRDYKRAFDLYTTAAKRGCIRALDRLGWMYFAGHGVKKDYKRSCDYFHKAAAQDESFGEESLFFMYCKGYGVKKDYAKAAFWCRKAALKGQPVAECSLGSLYEVGMGVKKDYKQAFDWYTKAAEAGSPEAELRLGSLYEHGHGVPKDVQKAIALYKKAKADGSKWADKSLKKLERTRGSQDTGRKE